MAVFEAKWPPRAPRPRPFLRQFSRHPGGTFSATEKTHEHCTQHWRRRRKCSPRVRAGAEKLAWHKIVGGNAPTLEVSSVAFEAANPLPISATADGVGAPPPIAWQGVPPDAQTIVLLVEDPDAPFPEPFVHWLVYDIPARVAGIDAQSEAQQHWKEGKNSRFQSGFTPAAPPAGHGLHRYHFQVFALDIALGLEADAGRSSVLEAMTGHVLAWGELVGTYERE